MFTEAVGLPMSMMSRVMYYHPEQMPTDAYDFMLKICTKEEWKKYYHGDFNSVKRNSYNAFLTITPEEFFKLFIRTTLASPGCSLNALIETTSLGIDPFWYNEICQEMFVLGNTVNLFIAKMLILRPWGWFFLASGFIVLLLIVFGTYAFLKRGLCTLLMVTPCISYTWGTSLLLSGCDHRYFWGILISGIPIIAILIASHQEMENN